MKGEDLSIDIGCFGNVKNPKHLIIHSSGVHGVDGFHGSAIQIDLIHNEIPKLDLKDTCIMFIHCVNPYGMSWYRRWNENNVDLNRNFFYKTKEDEYKNRGTPEVYKAWPFDDILNPHCIYVNHGFTTLWCCILALLLVWQYGKKKVKQAIVQGQNEYPKGLFFGGTELENGPKQLLDWLHDNFSKKSYESLYHIDVHSGLGKWAEDILLCGVKDDTELIKTYGKDRIMNKFDKSNDSKEGYRLKGSIGQPIEKMLKAKKTISFCQEFGTYDNLTVLQALRYENSMWNEFGERIGKKHEAKVGLLKTFYPRDDKDWKEKVLKRGKAVFNQTTKKIKEQ